MKRLITLLLTIALSFAARGADILGGFISARHVEGLTYDITLTTWTNLNHLNSKRCAADLYIFLNGVPGFVLDVPRINGPSMSWIPYGCTVPSAKAGENFRPMIVKSVYQTRYTFTGTGKARILYQALGREINLVNLTRPDITQFVTECEFEVFSGGTPNSTPALQADLIRSATPGAAFSFQNYVSNPDSDNLNFKLQTPGLCTGYKQLSDALYGGGAFSIDAASGQISWNTPGAPGFYLVSVRIEDFRGGMQIGFSTMDFVIEADRKVGLDAATFEGLSISPNPAREAMELRLALAKAGELQLTLLDPAGRSVYAETLRVAAGEFSQRLQLPAGLSPGIYLLRLRSDGETATRKVVIR